MVCRTSGGVPYSLCMYDGHMAMGMWNLECDFIAFIDNDKKEEDFCVKFHNERANQGESKSVSADECRKPVKYSCVEDRESDPDDCYGSATGAIGLTEVDYAVRMDLCDVQIMLKGLIGGGRGFQYSFSF